MFDEVYILFHYNIDTCYFSTVILFTYAHLSVKLHVYMLSCFLSIVKTRFLNCS